MVLRIGWLIGRKFEFDWVEFKIFSGEYRYSNLGKNMGKLTGIIKFIGRFGLLSVYEMNGKHVVRQAYGPDGETIDKNPNYQGLRERNLEFGEVSKAGKLLRSGFLHLLQKLGDTTVHGRLTKVLNLVKNLDQKSEKGKRNVQNGLDNEAGRKLVSGFNCNGNGMFDPLILEAGRKAVVSKKIALAWSEQLICPKDCKEIHLELVWMKVDFDGMQNHSIASEMGELGPQKASLEIEMPEALPNEKGFLFLAIAVWYMRANGFAVGEEKWRILGVV